MPQKDLSTFLPPSYVSHVWLPHTEVVRVINFALTKLSQKDMTQHDAKKARWRKMLKGRKKNIVSTQIKSEQKKIRKMEKIRIPLRF